MNLNRVTIVGRMAADPETRTIPSGQNVTTLRVATNRVWNNQAGEKQEQVEFHTVVAWGRLAEIASRYLRKGQLAMFEGRLQTRSWDGQDGARRYRTEIVAENLQLGPKAMGASSGGDYPPQQTPQNQQNRSNYSGSSPRQEVKDDDIPVINEDDATPADDSQNSPDKQEQDNDVEEEKIDLKDIPF